jgi:phosphoribosylformylglycinamidine synthase
MLMKVLGRFNVCSKERLIRQYDHEVQAQTVIKPLVGVLNDGPADAAVLRPLPDSFRGVAIGCGIAPKYSDIDTYWMTACVIDEAVRNIVAVGADPDYAAGLDNFCWCDPVQSEKTPDGEYKLAQLVRANQALYDVTVPYGIPCISGKDSMKNDYHIGDTKISIPPTILFTAVGIVPDVRKAVSSDVKRAGDLVYVLGLTRDETGGSEYFAELGFIGRKVPTLPNPPAAMDIYRTVHKVMQAGLIASCHDVSDGGLGVCLAETAFGGGFGVRAALRDVPGEGLVRDDDALFSESPGRFVVTVRPAHQAPFEEAFSGMPVARIGEVTDAPRLVITGLTGAVIVDADILDLKHAWQKPLGV